MKIHIEYCVKWNYGPEFDRVSNQIKKMYPNAIIAGNESPPRTGAFEILLDGKLVYSKFETDTFPKQNELESLLND